MVPHSWTSDCLEVFGLVENRKFIRDSMWSWKLNLTLFGESLGDVHIQSKIFLWDSISSLLFAFCEIHVIMIHVIWIDQTYFSIKNI